MKQPKLYKLCSNWKKGDWDLFIRYLSTSEKKNSDVYSLACYLRNEIPSYPSLEDVRKELFPHSSRKNIQNKYSKLVAVVLEYFTYTQLQKATNLKSLLLFEYFIDNSHVSEAAQLFTKEARRLSEEVAINIEALYILHRFHHKLFFSRGYQKFDLGLNLLDESSFALSNYASFQELKIKIELQHISGLGHPLKRKSDTEIDDVLKDSLEHLHRICSLLEKVTESPNVESVTDLLNQLNSRIHNYPLSELFLMSYQIGLNHTKRLLQNGLLTNKNLLLGYYEFGIESGAYETDGYMTELSFTNIINSACALSKLDWAFELLNKYDHKINPKERDDALNMSMAMIELERHDFNTSLGYIDEVSLTSIPRKVRYRWIRHTCLCMLRDPQYDTFEKSSAAFYKNNKDGMSPNTYLLSINHNKAIRKLYFRRHDELKEFLKTNPTTALKSWILKHINRNEEKN